MGSWRKRKKEVDNRTEEVNKKYGIGELIEDETLREVSGKVDKEVHYRTLRNGQIRACKNPKQEMKGASLRNAHKMRDVMAQAREEYRDEKKRELWQKRYEKAVAEGRTETKVLWNYICQQVYRKM